jgi:SET domain-containing protein 6
MVPVVDLLNHSPTSKVGHMYSESDGLFKIITQQPWKGGEEICLNYGHVANERLVMLYGFALTDNPYNAVNLYASMDPSAPHVKKHALDLMGIPTDASVPFQVDAKTLPAALLAFLRVQHATPMESASATHLQGAATKPLSTETELKACRALRQALADMLAGYPETAAEDEQLLVMQGALGYIERLAITFRLSEKRVLASAISLVSTYEERLLAV